MDETFDKQEWNEFVSASKWGDILQFWQWGETKKNEGWTPIFVKSNGDKVRSMGLVKRASFLGNILYVPHGPIFHSVEDLENEISSWRENLLEAAKANNCFAVEVEPKVGKLVDERIGNAENLSEDEKQKYKVIEKNANNLAHFMDERIIEALSEEGFKFTGKNMQPKYKLLYSLKLSDEELMGLMSKSTRYNIKYAEKHGVEVNEYLPGDPVLDIKLQEFYGLMEETQKRTGGYPIRPYSSFVKLFDSFKGTNNLSLFEAKFEDDLIIMNISQRTEHWASSFYAGSNRLHPKVKAPYLIRWKSIQKARKFGSEVYDFWGIIPHSAQHKGYSDHKLSFGGARIDYVGLMRVELSPIKVMLFDLLNSLRVSIYKIKRKLF